MTLSENGYPSVNDIKNVWTKSQKIEFFENSLKSINRPGMDNVIAFCQSTDFYMAPSSTNYHSNYDGGLLDHVLLVYSTATELRSSLIKLKPELEQEIPAESVILSTLLHDVCKTSFYKKVEKFRKNDMDRWEKYYGYEIDDSFPIGHGEKSVIMLQNFGLTMTPQEMIAIRFHMGAWDGAMMTNDVKYSYQKAMDCCPLMILLQTADNTSSLMFEDKVVPPAI